MPRFSSRSSSVSAYDDIDAITPCPLPAAVTTTKKTSSSSPPPSHAGGPSPPPRSRSHHSEEDEKAAAPRQWRRSSCTSSTGNDRSPSPTHSAGALSEAASEEDLGTFASRRRDSVRALERGAGGDPERLWRRMLALQQVYGCYNSARMSAALESGDASLLLRPSRACLDLLNDHMVLLPDDADYILRDNYTAATATSSSSSSSEHHTNH